MGLSASQVLMALLNSNKNYDTTVDDINDLTADKQQVKADKRQTEGNLRENYSEADLLQKQNNLQTNQLNEYHELLAETLENDDPMNKMYCGIKEFVIDNSGMCGMGMGMGSLELNSDLKLTGAELLAMSQTLNDNSDGALDAKGLVDKLHELGIENAQVSQDGSEIELTRVDEDGNETKVKFKDANGDGMLNGCDYDFSDALAKFNEDLKAFNQKVTELEQNIEQTARDLSLTESQQKTVASFIDYLEGVKANQELTIKKVDEQIEIDKAQAENLQKRMAELKQDLQDIKDEEDAQEAKEKEEAQEAKE
ncbi:hypothetical protein IJ531_00225, partial [bacterium]|nr:hypothetical protein [bacterium]